jgi:hypothetical protein
MNETTTTYEFWTLSGQHLENATTDDPGTYASELSHFHGVDADEIEWVEYDPAEWE